MGVGKMGPAVEEESVWDTPTIGQEATIIHDSRQRVFWAPLWCANANTTSFSYSLARTWHPSVVVVVLLLTASEDGHCNNLM